MSNAEQKSRSTPVEKYSVHFHFPCLYSMSFCHPVYLSTHAHLGSAVFEQLIYSIPQLLLMTAMSAVNLTLATHTSPIFSFQSALVAVSSGYVQPGIQFDPTVLFSAGCHVVNNTSNCTAVCQDAGLIFTKPYTMQNCMVLASLGSSPTGINASGSLTPLQNHTFNSQSLTIASSFSIELTDPRFPSLALNVNKTISECLQQYCNTILIV